MNADRRGSKKRILKTKILSALIGVHLRLKTVSSLLLTVAAPKGAPGYDRRK
jgi:hypothetical protein